MNWRRLLRATPLGAWCFALGVGGLNAQAKLPTPSTPRRTVLPDTLRVYLITIGEGKYYWEKFGHNALWFVNPARGIDAAYNWGTFDFGAPDFLARQIIGDPQYSVQGVPGSLLFDFYRQSDRTIELQRLSLTPAQANTAYAYTTWNARDENKFYRYDYFRDNCSTRVRDVIDRALGGALKTWTGSTQVDRSYRGESLRLVDDMKLVQFGIDIALGEPADRRLSVWEDMFVPSRLRDVVREVRVNVSGNEVPLVRGDTILYRSTSHAERDTFPSLEPVYLIIGVLIALEFLAVGWLQRWAPAETVFLIEAAVWQTIVGLLGAVLLLAWLITQHVFWYRNENLLVANPLSLFLGGLLIAAIWRQRFLRPAFFIAIVCAALSILALIGKITNVLPQSNAEIVLMLLPPHVAVAYRLWRRVRQPAVVTEPVAA